VKQHIFCVGGGKGCGDKIAKAWRRSERHGYGFAGIGGSAPPPSLKSFS